MIGTQTALQNLDEKFLGLRSLRFEDLIAPEPIFRVRAINAERRSHLRDSLLRRGTMALSSQLTAMCHGPKYMIIDGNHRYHAMKDIREKEGRQNAFSSISVRVYDALPQMQALSLGFMRNSESEDVMHMTDYDIVMTAKRIFSNLSIQEDEGFTRLYELMHAYSVSW